MVETVSFGEVFDNALEIVVEQLTIGKSVYAVTNRLAMRWPAGIEVVDVKAAMKENPHDPGKFTKLYTSGAGLVLPADIDDERDRRFQCHDVREILIRTDT